LLCQASERFMSYIGEGIQQGSEVTREARSSGPAAWAAAAKGVASGRRLGDDLRRRYIPPVENRSRTRW
jgi:hypothetical protein